MTQEASQILTAIESSWSHRQPPSILAASPKDLEDIDMEKRLAGLTYDAWRETSHFHSHLPFLALMPEAATYYMAGYMKHIVEEIEQGGPSGMLGSIPFIHLSAWLESSSGFATCRHCLSDDQLKVVDAFMHYLKQNGLENASV